MSDKRYQEEYLRRIHKVQDYIEQHTGRALTVEELSNVAGFSMFHFSRIFQVLHWARSVVNCFLLRYKRIVFPFLYPNCKLVKEQRIKKNAN